MQKKHVQIVRIQPFQNAVRSFQDMLTGAVIHLAGYDTAFGLQEQLVSLSRIRLQEFTEHLLAFSGSVDVRMIKKYGIHIQGS